MPAAAPNSFSVNRISVLFNWQNFNSCKFFSVFLMKTGAAKFWICISIDYYSTLRNRRLDDITDSSPGKQTPEKDIPSVSTFHLPKISRKSQNSARRGSVQVSGVLPGVQPGGELDVLQTGCGEYQSAEWIRNSGKLRFTISVKLSDLEDNGRNETKIHIQFNVCLLPQYGRFFQLPSIT